MLCWLAPGVYNEFPQFALGESNLLHLVVSCVDARQLQELVCMVVQGQLIPIIINFIFGYNLNFYESG